MTKDYTLKLEDLVKKIVDAYNEIDIFPIKYNATSKRLKPVIYKEVNRMLDFLEKEKKDNNPVLIKLLKKEHYKGVSEMIERNKRF
ncbi:hypothetical protein LCGC14_0930810 [marine sediment metagenome]|uniref:Uncharacterized protein n=1 Tax=marine sediment metagenome TaxID=412755 RepID=A0A0F9P8Y1_9ZZZZ|nr:hypothetical protein [archaeon]